MYVHVHVYLQINPDHPSAAYCPAFWAGCQDNRGTLLARSGWGGGCTAGSVAMATEQQDCQGKTGVQSGTWISSKPNIIMLYIYMYMYVHVHCTCICTYNVHVHIYTCTCAWVQCARPECVCCVCVHLFLLVCLHVHVHMYIRTCRCVHIFTMYL